MHPLDLLKQTALIITNEEMDDIMKIVNSPEDAALFLKGLSETIQDKAKEQKSGFLSLLLGILAASLLGNLLEGKGEKKAKNTRT